MTKEPSSRKFSSPTISKRWYARSQPRIINAANERNVRVMDQYSNATTTTQGALPTDYGVLKSDGATISITQPETPPEIGG